MQDTSKPVWHYVRDGAAAGPVTDEHLRSLAGGGQLRQTDLVWRAGWTQWATAAQVPGLVFPPSAGPAPLPSTVPVGNACNPPTQRNLGDDVGMRMLLPVGRSGWAIAAGYAGLISVLLLPAPLAIVFSILAMRDMKLHPEKHGLGRAIFGLIMGSIGTLVLLFAAVGFVARVM